MNKSTTFSDQDVRAYYDQTEVHYRMFWKLEEGLGLHYGVWESGIKKLAEAIQNTNRALAHLGNWQQDFRVLDAGCGVGGSAQFLAKNFDCQVHGITLSEKQVNTAEKFAEKNNLQHLLRFSTQSYTKTNFRTDQFDAAWAIESMQTATDKKAFFQEMQRIIKPGGQLFIGDMFKAFSYSIQDQPRMQKLLHGWAMSDLLDFPELISMAEEHGFILGNSRKVTEEVRPSVWRIYLAALAGMIGTKWYNLFHNGAYFGRIHYTTGINQFWTYRQKLWDYQLAVFTKK